MGLSGGIVCEVVAPEPDGRVPTFISVVGERGQVFLARPRPVLIEGRGAAASPVYPGFLDQPAADAFTYTIERLIRAHQASTEPYSSGDDYRHSLEVAIALVRSAHREHERVSLPFAARHAEAVSAPLSPHGRRCRRVAKYWLHGTAGDGFLRVNTMFIW